MAGRALESAPPSRRAPQNSAPPARLARVLAGPGARFSSDSKRSAQTPPPGAAKETGPASDLGAKDAFNLRFPHINVRYYTELTQELLTHVYPRACEKCGGELTKLVANRETVIRCGECHHQMSRTVGTPLHHLKLPLWTFGYLLTEAVQAFPQMISAAQIRRRLGVSKSTSLLLKRRLQLMLTDLLPAVRELVNTEISSVFRDEVLPADTDARELQDAPVVHMDTLALFSATQRSNGGRSRHRHGGQTASIYLSDKVAMERGKFQIGTLAHTIALKGGAVLLDSVPDQTQRSIEPLTTFLPNHAPTFTDDGYPWLSRYNRNHRAVNHSARAKNKSRNVWARDRWCKGGVHNQVAEGNQRMIKLSFLAAYGYFTPEYSQLYLNEYSGLKALRVYGIKPLLSRGFFRINTGTVGNVDPG